MTTVLIWNTKDFSSKDRKSVRGNLQFDHAEHVCWSPDSKAFLIHKSAENTMEVYKLTRKPNGNFKDIEKAITFPQYSRDAIVIAMQMAINGKFIMTCDNQNQLILWTLKGVILEKMDTRHGDTYSAVISPCGRFIATTGFTPDAKVYEVRYNKAGIYESLKRVFGLKGHSSGIYNCSINCDSSKMVTVSKDGTWRLYNTLVEYAEEQEPYFLLSGEYTKCEDQPAFVALSPDSRTIVVGSGPNMSFYSAITGDGLYTIKNIYLDHIVKILIEPESKYVLTLGDKHVHVFHNVAGYYTTIQDLERSKCSAKTSAMHERIATQIAEAKAALKSMNKALNK